MADDIKKYMALIESNDSTINLMENFDVLQDYIDSASSGTFASIFQDSSNDILRDAKKLNMHGEHIVDIYKILVRNNIPLDAIDATYIKNPRDASEWISAIKSKPNFVIGHFQTMVRMAIFDLHEKKEWKENEKNYKVLYKDDQWILFKVEHEAAACKLGTKTTWCISSTTTNHFNDYHKYHDIYMVHTTNEKYAIIVNIDTHQIYEVQYSANNSMKPTVAILQKFADTMSEDGVSIDILEEKIGTTIAMQPPYQKLKRILFIADDDEDRAPVDKPWIHSVKNYTIQVELAVREDPSITENEIITDGMLVIKYTQHNEIKTSMWVHPHIPTELSKYLYNIISGWFGDIESKYEAEMRDTIASDIERMGFDKDVVLIDASMLANILTGKHEK